MTKITDKALPKGTELHGPEHTYIVQKVLGSGSFGITYRATSMIQVGNITQALDFAIKEYFPDSFCTRSSLNVTPHAGDIASFRGGKTDFVSEARKLYGLGTENPNIVKVNEVFEENGTAYYVMQYVDGKALTNVVPYRGLPYNDAISLLLPIMRAVSFLHRKRINHLDIKPDNIMMTTGNQPILVDFGQSIHFKKSGEGTSSKKVPGATDGFAPPEQYAGIQTFSPQSDVYALTATLCYMLTGRTLPKSTDLTRQMIEDALRDKLPQEDLKEAFHQGLARAVEDRTASVDQLILNLGIEDIPRPEGNDIKPDRPTDPITHKDFKQRLKDHATILRMATVAIVAIVAVILLFIIRPDERVDDQTSVVPVEPIIQPVETTTDDSIIDSCAVTPSKPDPAPTVVINSDAKQLDLGYGTWVGGVKNGKPHGEGRLTYTQTHRVANVGTNYTEASPGDYVVAEYEEGEYVMGTLYDSNGNKKASIIP